MNKHQPRRLKIGIIDLLHRGSTKALYSRIMNANFGSIMPQVIGVWCEQEGHEVSYFCYTGFENLEKEIPKHIDIAFICGFTQSALLAYAISNKLRKSGVITVLGGPHARCYPEDALKYFDYVTGFTNKSLISEILKNPEKQVSQGVYLSSNSQPDSLPGLVERWKFVEPTLNKAPLVKIVPMLSSFGCPYSCPFCIDAGISYKMLETETIREDLRFVAKMRNRPIIAWHDPNFGVRFNNIMQIIEETAAPGTLKFVAESSLSILTEKNLRRLHNNGFLAFIIGIESWTDLGRKSKTYDNSGTSKVSLVAEHINQINKYIPYIQTNMIFGFDSDHGTEPFELTKRFIDLTPSVLGAYTLLTAYGEATPDNLIFQKENRVIPFPFSFLNNEIAMNIRPKNYDWIEFYDHLIDLLEYSFSWKAIVKRSFVNKNYTAKIVNFIRGISREGIGKLNKYRIIRQHLADNSAFRDFFEGKTNRLPDFYYQMIKQELGNMFDWLPKGAIYHDHLAYLKKSRSKTDQKIKYA